MRASTILYRTFIFPAMMGGIVTGVMFALMKVFGITAMFGWAINLKTVFFATTLVVMLFPDIKSQRKPEPEASSK